MEYVSINSSSTDCPFKHHESGDDSDEYRCFRKGKAGKNGKAIVPIGVPSQGIKYGGFCPFENPKECNARR